MMKTKLFLFLVGLLSLTMLTSCSEDEDNNPFVGKWQLVNIEDGEIVIDPGTVKVNQFIYFQKNGNLKYGDGKATYRYDGQNLVFHFSSYNGSKNYSYSFSDDNNTLILILIKQDMGNLMIDTGVSSLSLVGKIQIFKRIE